MKNVWLKLVCLAGVSLSTQVMADDGISKNPVLRPIVMNDGGIEVTGVVGHMKKVNGKEESFAIPGIRYGITDNLTVGVEGVSYRFYQDDGLELGANVGFRNSFDTEEHGYSIAYGAAIFGKKVINNDFAINFGIDFVHWEEEKLDDADEIDYHLGFMYNIAPDWTLSAAYTYRDLDGFSQSHADVYMASLSYAYSDDIDVGIFAIDNNFKQQLNGRYVHNEIDQGAGVFVNWRF